MELEVMVPATVANLGPGFDCLGVAVGVHLGLRFSGSSKPEVIGDVTPLPENLTHRAFVAAFEAGGSKAPPVRIEVAQSYPSARGMGASASAIVAGLVAARGVGDLSLTDAELARLAIQIEGHPDNVLPALFGGVVLTAGVGWMRFEPVSSIAPVILIAREKMKTRDARAILPGEVPRADAVANAAATVGLVAVLTGAQGEDALLMSTEDRLHEPYRLPMMPETFELHEALRSKGIATALAGAGPSLIALVESGAIQETFTIASDLAPAGWQILAPGWDLAGAQVR